MDKERMMREALLEAVSRAGSQRALGKLICKSQQLVGYWVEKGKVSANAVLDVERVTQVARYRLRPDLYPVEDFEDVSGEEQTPL